MRNVNNSYRSTFRFMVVAGTGLFFMCLGIYSNALFLNWLDVKEIAVTTLAQSSVVIPCIGIIIGMFFCKLLHNILAFEGKAFLPKALRITEAMAMLHAIGNNEKIHAIKYYGIKIYKVSHDLGSEPVENINCQEISGFHSWLFYIGDRDKYLGYEKICCNYDDIQKIIKYNKEKWCTKEKLEIDELQEKNKQLEENIMKVTLSESELEEKKNELLFKEVEIANLSKENEAQSKNLRAQKIEIDKQLLDIDEEKKFLTNQELKADKKLPIFLDAMRQLAQSRMDKSGFTTGKITETLKSVAKQHKVTSIKVKWVKEFKDYLPKSWRNQGGSPIQGEKQIPPLT